MSVNNSTRLLKAKIEYKKGLLDAERKTSVENIKPVQNEAVTPKKASLIRTMFANAVNVIKSTMETDYTHEFAQKKAIASFMKVDTRNQKVAEEILNM